MSLKNKSYFNDKIDDFYRMYQKDGSITFNKIKMVNLVFVKHLNDPSRKTYVFSNPCEGRLEKGHIIQVETRKGDATVEVVGSAKIPCKYLEDILCAFGTTKNRLKPIISRNNE